MIGLNGLVMSPIMNEAFGIAMQLNPIERVAYLNQLPVDIAKIVGEAVVGAMTPAYACGMPPPVRPWLWL